MTRRGESFLIAAAAVVLLISGCGHRLAHEVVVIEKTKSFHTDDCPRVKMAQTKVMTIAEARALECKPCKGCRPDSGE